MNPVSTFYDGQEVFELQPKGLGVASLNLLNILSEQRRSIDSISAERSHRQIHLAFGIALSKRISSELIVDKMVPDTPSFDAVNLYILARDCLACSFIGSLFYEFGTDIQTEESGTMLQSGGNAFSLVYGNLHALAPAKLTLQTVLRALAQENE